MQNWNRFPYNDADSRSEQAQLITIPGWQEKKEEISFFK
jgi:hypothetical protein